MPPQEFLLSNFEDFRQKATKYQIEPFVIDFLHIWLSIHENVKKHSLDTMLEFSNEILNSLVLPFYERFKGEGNMERYERWLESHASVVLKWANRGSFFFPLSLITYEVCYHQKGLLDSFIRQILANEVRGSKEALFEYLLPVLTNFIIPLDEVDLALLKAAQILEQSGADLYKSPSRHDYASHTTVSTRTVFRRLTTLNLLQVMIPNFFLDMGKLGYETNLFVHSNPFPKKFEKNLLFSADLIVSTFSIVQMPYNHTKEIVELQDQLDLLTSYNMTQRVSSWNLSGLSIGEDPWKKSPPLLYGEPAISIITPQPRMDLSLRPTFDPFRKLSPADIKILEFVTTTGNFKNITKLSKSINISSGVVSERLNEYSNNNLLIKMNQFFNVGLDLSVFFFVSSETDEIPWLQHFSTFPKVDVFHSQSEKPYTYFGYLKMPNKWIKPFARKVDLIKRDFGVKFYYKIASSTDHVKWGILLSKTYH